MKNSILIVQGMSCNHCSNAIESALKALKITSQVDLANKTVQVEFDENITSLAAIKKVIEDQGYRVQ